ncbi:hypothetical protein O9H85_15350 [Paenibacillus filicis]|uniref:Uncharacterized protein n=1 Tax=Paenibacillus gyeongsangnamensis TaxID=3388067 RepID=A0ABT4QA66_9BACL|nr:hypothetical protein [Paenibacillus filicis]MCZ8513784.1 hypothetical protein [Paenibacillus filicis]
MPIDSLIAMMLLPSFQEGCMALWLLFVLTAVCLIIRSPGPLEEAERPPFDAG